MLIEILEKLAVGLLFMFAVGVSLFVKLHCQAIHLLGGKAERMGLCGVDAKSVYMRRYSVIPDIIVLVSLLSLPFILIAKIYNIASVIIPSVIFGVAFLIGLFGKLKIYISVDAEIQRLAFDRETLGEEGS